MKTKYLVKLSAAIASVVLIAVLSLLQSNILKVNAALQVLLVSDTAIPFGNVYPGENLSRTYTVQLDTSSKQATYNTVLEAVGGKENLCPFLEIKNIDLPNEPDTLATSSLSSILDNADNWRVKLNVPGISGQLAQAHDGGIVVKGGDYECKITVTTNTVEVFGEGFIQGIKFNDLNGDGVKNNSEIGLGGWQIYIDQNSNAIYDFGEKITTTATTTGFYEFEFLPAGNYTVREVLQNNWQQTLPGAGAGYKYEVFVDNFTAEDINFGNRFVEGSGGCTDGECSSGGGGSGGVADLSLLKTVSAPTSTASSTLIYTFSVSNSGPNTAENVIMTDVLPPELLFISSTSTQGGFVPNVWTVGNLASGSSASLTILAEVKSSVSVGTSIVNTATVQSAEADPNLSNNTSGVQIQVVCPQGQICTSSLDEGGGGSGGGGSGGSGGSTFVPLSGQVAGDFTNQPGAANFGLPENKPMVLGQATQLPRTGVSAGALLVVFLVVILMVNLPYKFNSKL